MTRRRYRECGVLASRSGVFKAYCSRASLHRLASNMRHHCRIGFFPMAGRKLGILRAGVSVLHLSPAHDPTSSLLGPSSSSSDRGSSRPPPGIRPATARQGSGFETVRVREAARRGHTCLRRFRTMGARRAAKPGPQSSRTCATADVPARPTERASSRRHTARRGPAGAWTRRPPPEPRDQASFNRFAGRPISESSGSPLLFVPGRLAVRMSLSSWLTLREGYCSAQPSKQLSLGRSAPAAK